MNLENNEKISLEIMLLNDLYSTNVIDNIIYNLAVEKLKKSEVDKKKYANENGTKLEKAS